MATAQISNFIEPTVFSAYTKQKTTALNVLLSSGAILHSPVFDGYAAQAGSIGELPFFNPLTWSESNIGSDDPTQRSVPDTISGGNMIYRTEYREKDWSAMDLTSAVIGEDFGKAIADGVAGYWARDDQAHALARLAGMAASAPEIVNNVAVDTVIPNGGVAAANSANFGTILDTKATMGDHSDNIALIVMHSKVYFNLMKLEPTAFTAPSSVQDFVTYNGMRVLRDDNVTVTQGTNRLTYNTYLLGQGAMVYGEASVPKATEVWRDPAAGMGWAEERLYSRRQFILHPVGFTTNVTVAPASRTKSLTLAQWSAAGTLQRVYDRKNVPVAILQSNA